MNKIMLITTTTAIVLFTGCTGGGPDMSKPSVRQAISSVTVYDNLEGRQFAKKGTVEARYCQNDGVQSSMSMMGSTTKENAVLEMKNKAYTMGGNGIINLMCQGDGLHFKTNCNNSVNCYGDVVRVSK